MWLINGSMYGWYSEGILTTFDRNERFTRIKEVPASLLLDDGWTFAIGEIPQIHKDWLIRDGNTK